MAYFVLWSFDVVGYSDKWEEGAFLFVVALLGMPWLPIFGLSMRNRFDLLRMADGTSAISRFIWSALSLSFILVMLYGFWVDIVLAWDVVRLSDLNQATWYAAASC